VDQRADLFSLGAILYEMLAGRRAFTGETGADIISAVLQLDPAPLQALSPMADRVLRRCLRKSQDERFQSARDLAFHLESMLDSTREVPQGATATPLPPASPARRWLPWVLAAVATSAAVWMAGSATRRAAAPGVEEPLRRFSISTADAPLFPVERPPLAISPDGGRVAYVVGDNAAARIVVRNLDELVVTRCAAPTTGFRRSSLLTASTSASSPARA
jgi:serine/threonine protein kinase